jgi:translocation and assembly module TamA
MVVPSLRSLVAAATLAWCLPTSAQTLLARPTQAGETAAQPAAFDIHIEAPDDIRLLLERNLDLQRYRVLQDLSDSEIQTLLLATPQEIAGLAATLGYFSPRIQVDLDKANGLQARTVRMVVEPGQRTTVRAIHLALQGPIAQDERSSAQRQAIQDGWLLPESEYFSQARWDEAKGHALKQLLTERFATARMVDSQADIDADAAYADLALTLDSGVPYRIGSLEVQGQERYGDALVRRFAALSPGQDYTASKLADAQKRLTDSGYYDSAYLSLDTASDPENAIVHAQVKEAKLQKVVWGIGASTDSGARWSAEHTHNQVPGIGWRAVNKVASDRNTQTFTSDWTSQPDDSQWRWAASALVQQQSIAEIDVSTKRYRAGRFTTQTALDQSYYLQFERTQAVFRETDESKANEALTANYAFALRRFDSIPFPERGWGIGGELGVGSVLGAKQEPYSRLLLNGRIYQPLERPGDSLFSRQRAGRMVYRAQAGGVFVDNATSVPFSQLFLTGGDTTVRGYKRDEIGVTHDGVLSAESGRYMANASIEWQRPIVRNGVMTEWETAVFVDTGAVANRTEEFSFKSGVGVGARWKSPIGPLQMDVAYGIATQSFRLHLNVGFVF